MRLIDEQTTNEAVQTILKKYGFHEESIISDEIWDCIENLPTAYDMDEIIEQLEKRMNKNAKYSQLKGNTNTKTISLICRADEDKLIINLIKNYTKNN